jgi:periplasmic protein TonB
VVDVNGKAISCIVTAASGVPEFDAIVCEKVQRRARFTPAIDAQGRPTIGQWKSRARFGQSSTDIPIN